VLLAVLPGVAALAGVYLLMPGVWQTSVQRFGAVLDWDANLESSAESRWTIALNAPVFTIDSYWLAGHGYSSYRFVAEEHLAGITRGVSRSLYNFLITVWYDAGLAGTVLWILVFVQLFRRFRTIREKARHSEIQALAHGLTGAAAGILVAAMFGETPYNWRVMGFFYASAGVCLAAYRWERRLAAR
jgi:O-antigen ligase